MLREAERAAVALVAGEPRRVEPDHVDRLRPTPAASPSAGSRAARAANASASARAARAPSPPRPGTPAAAPGSGLDDRHRAARLDPRPPSTPSTHADPSRCRVAATPTPRDGSRDRYRGCRGSRTAARSGRPARRRSPSETRSRADSRWGGPGRARSPVNTTRSTGTPSARSAARLRAHCSPRTRHRNGASSRARSRCGPSTLRMCRSETWNTRTTRSPTRSEYSGWPRAGIADRAVGGGAPPTWDRAGSPTWDRAGSPTGDRAGSPTGDRAGSPTWDRAGASTCRGSIA